MLEEGFAMEQTRELPASVVGLDRSAPSITDLRWAGAPAPLLRAHIRAKAFDGVPPGNLEMLWPCPRLIA